MSNFKISNDLTKFKTQSDIDLAVQMLNLMRNKSYSEIQDITDIIKSIARDNVKL